MTSLPLRFILIHHLKQWLTRRKIEKDRKITKIIKKTQKFEYLENEKSFLDEIKSIFHSFGKAIIW